MLGMTCELVLPLAEIDAENYPAVVNDGMTCHGVTSSLNLFVYNLNTKVLAAGIYRLCIEPGGGGGISAQIQVK